MGTKLIMALMTRVVLTWYRCATSMVTKLIMALMTRVVLTCFTCSTSMGTKLIMALMTQGCPHGSQVCYKHSYKTNYGSNDTGLSSRVTGVLHAWVQN